LAGGDFSVFKKGIPGGSATNVSHWQWQLYMGIGGRQRGSVPTETCPTPRFPPHAHVVLSQINALSK